jgi:DNA-binding response OmpR family regulator
MGGNMLDILIVEDNKEIAVLLNDFLEKENYVVGIADSGEKALRIFEMYGAKLVVLDINLPGMDGFSVCSKIREKANTPILIASARTGKSDQLTGLELGADDYIEKPYDIDILLAKIRGIFKRKYETEELRDGELILNTANQTLRVGEKDVTVTNKEFELLKLLIENKGTTMKKEYLFNTIWGSDSESEPQTLNVHINGLRKRIEKDPKKPDHIQTVWGVGYRYM